MSHLIGQKSLVYFCLSSLAPVFSAIVCKSLIARRRRRTQSSMATSTANSRAPTSPSSVVIRLATCRLVLPPWSQRALVPLATRLSQMASNSINSSRHRESQLGGCSWVSLRHAGLCTHYENSHKKSKVSRDVTNSPSNTTMDDCDPDNDGNPGHGALNNGTDPSSLGNTTALFSGLLSSNTTTPNASDPGSILRRVLISDLKDAKPNHIPFESHRVKSKLKHKHHKSKPKHKHHKHKHPKHKHHKSKPQHKHHKSKPEHVGSRPTHGMAKSGHWKVKPQAGQTKLQLAHTRPKPQHPESKP